MFKTYLMLAFLIGTNVFAENYKSNISVEMSSHIIASAQLNPTDGFNDFLTHALNITNISKQPALALTIERYLTKEKLSNSEQHMLHRLLGLYSRVKYGDDAMDTLAQLVAIPTFNVEGLEQHKNPEFLKMGKTIAALANQFNLAFRNIDNRVFEISIKGQSEEVIALHAHADVVPVTPSLWVLDDGTKLNPFKLTRIGNRMYGRGTEDDKNGIVVTMYAMKVIQEENIPLMRNFHLLIDTTEETTSEAIPYYFSKYPTPNYNIALDGDYPVVIAEKGFASIKALFPIRTAEQNKLANAEIVNVTGGLAINQIPAASVATILTTDAENLTRQLNRLGTEFIAANGNNFSVLTESHAKGITLTLKGVSAHSSEPATGVNPVSRMFMFVEYIQQREGLFKFNHVTDAATYVASNWGLGFHGKKLGIDFSDEFMGPLTTSVTQIKFNDSGLQVGVNLRVPIGRSIEKLKTQVTQDLEHWKNKSATNVNFELSFAKPMYRNPEGHWVNALLDVATENLSMPREFGSSAGGTSVHNLPNGVQFGLAMPNKKYTGHNANEFKRVEQFLLDLQIVTEMIARVGQIPEMN